MHVFGAWTEPSAADHATDVAFWNGYDTSKFTQNYQATSLNNNFGASTTSIDVDGSSNWYLSRTENSVNGAKTLAKFTFGLSNSNTIDTATDRV